MYSFLSPSNLQNTISSICEISIVHLNLHVKTIKMRAAMRLLASVKPERFLEAGNPTGLTGLFTHSSPRPTLLYLYSATLEKLKAIPEHSVYRQSTEALTKHRYNIVDSFKPPGYDEWRKRAEEKALKYKNILSDPKQYPHRVEIIGESVYVVTEHNDEKDERSIEWDGEEDIVKSERSAGTNNQRPRRQSNRSNRDETDWESEPSLEAVQYVIASYQRAHLPTTSSVGYES